MSEPHDYAEHLAEAQKQLRLAEEAAAAGLWAAAIRAACSAQNAAGNAAEALSMARVVADRARREG